MALTVQCKCAMRVIAQMDDPGMVRHILEHLGRPVPDLPRNTLIPITYHLVPDIAKGSAKGKRCRTRSSYQVIVSRLP